MKFFKNTFAALLAVSMLTLAACSSEKKNLINADDDVSSVEVQSQQSEAFSFTTTDMDGKLFLLRITVRQRSSCSICGSRGAVPVAASYLICRSSIRNTSPRVL